MNLTDLRRAWRSLTMRGNRVFTAATVLTFALGIGAATSIFSIAHVVLLAPLPYQQADRVVHLTERNLGRGLPEFSVSMPNFLSWQQSASGFESLTALNGESANLGESGRVERVPAVRASASLWQTLGMPLVAGRAFTQAEDTYPPAPVVILGEGVWRSRFNADATLVGRNIAVNGVQHTVVGIAPQDVGFATDIEVWLPLAASNEIHGRGDRRLDVLGRLAPGVDIAQAQASLDGVSAGLASEFPEENEGWEGAIEPIREWIVGDNVRTRLLGMLAAVVLMMLVACTNVANLQIARAQARQREMGVRQALGAARSRLVSQMLVEGALLASIGGVLGLALASAAVQVAVAVLPASTPRLAAFALDWRAAALAIGASAATAFVFGLVPALIAMRRQPGAVLQHLGRSTVEPGRSPLRLVLVAVQFALATVLVTSAALLAQQLQRLQDASIGFPSERLLVARITQPQEHEEMDTTPHRLVHARLLDAVRALPGVESAGLTSEIPLGDFNTSMMVAAGAGGALTYRDESVQASWRVVSSDYLPTLGVPLLGGRGFEGDNESPRSMLLSEGLAQRLFGDAKQAVGSTVRLGNGQARNVVGVVGDVRQVGLGEDPTPTMYMPTTWLVTPTMTMVVRTSGDPATLLAPVREAAQRVSPAQPLFDLQSMSSVLRTSVAEPRVQTAVLLAFAGASLLLAAIGVAGVIAYLVARRAPEFAVRMALGASPHGLVRHVVRGGGLLCLVGVGAGLVLLLALSGLRERFGLDANVLPVVGLGVTLLLLVGLAASWLPARRVARISPNSVLRDVG